MKMSKDELKKILDNFDKTFNTKYENTKEEELNYRKQLLHESDKQIGEVVRRLKIKISRENLFMDDITREELK